MRKFKNFGITLADSIANFVGSWKFIIWQTIILLVWMLINVRHLVNFDPYPFILMNLLLSSQAAYATPMILMSGNRQAEKDREQLNRDIELDADTNSIIKEIHTLLEKMEQDLKLDRQAIKDHAEILRELKQIREQKQ